MKVLDLLRRRSSANVFSDQKISEEQLSLILEASTYSPRAGNLQHFSIRVIQEQSDLQTLSKLMFDDNHIKSASAVLIFFADLFTTRAMFEADKADYPFTNLVGYHYAFADSLLAMQCCATVAEDLGLSTRVLSASLLRCKAIARAFSCPTGVLPLFALALGIEAQPSNQRHNLNWNHYTRFGFNSNWPTWEEVYGLSGKLHAEEQVFNSNEVMEAKMHEAKISSYAQAISQFKYRRQDFEVFSANLKSLIGAMFENNFLK